MPWDIKKKGDQWCVHKKGSSSPVPGGCHSSRTDAIKHQRALYAKETTAASRIVNGVRFWTPNIETGTSTFASNVLSNVTVSFADSTAERDTIPWEGVLGVEGSPTSDMRYLLPGEIGARDLPLPLMVQTTTAQGHDGAENAGRIEAIEHIPVGEFEYVEEFGLEDVPEHAVVIWGMGVFDGSPAAEEAQRLIENGADISLDIPHDRLALVDPESFEEVDPEEVAFEDVLSGKYLTAIGGKIAGATVVTIGAFEEARIQLVDGVALVASAYGLRVKHKNSYITDKPITIAIGAGALTAAGKLKAPLKPPREWFEDPKLRELTPLQIHKDGRVFGHLADWDGCHTGFGTVCVPPFRSASNYAYFNVGEIETNDGSLVPCGKIMFCREGGKHAPTDRQMSVQEVAQHYDDATKVGAFVRAGSDRFGTWLAGALRADLDDLEIQHLRTHPPSGDWRPVKYASELVAAFSVPIPGFPIPRGEALVASAGGEITAIITAPLFIEPAELGKKRRQRKWKMLRSRYAALARDDRADSAPPVTG